MQTSRSLFTESLNAAIAIALTLGLQVGVAAQAPPAIDAEAGAAAIRLFERDPTLVLPVPRRETSAGKASLQYRLQDGRLYDVDIHTGQVWRVGYFGTESPRGAKGRISPQQATEIAHKFATEHFPTFFRKVTKTSLRDGGDMYRVEFREQAPATGASLPNWVEVVVNTRSGEVFMASLNDRYPLPAGVDQPPAVSEPQAIKKAAEAARMIRVTEVRKSILRWARHNGDRLIWNVELDGVFPGEIHGIRGVALDAQTGEVLSVRQPETPDYRIVKGPDGPQRVIVWTHSAAGAGLFGGSSPGGSPGGSAAGPASAVKGAGSSEGSSSSGDQPPGAAAGVASAAGGAGPSGGSSSGGLSPGSLAALGSLLALALAAGAIHLLRRRRTVAAGRAESPI